MRMDCANLQLAHLADADNRIAPEEYGSLHAGFSVAVLHRRLAELRCGARLLPLVDRRCKNGLARRAPPWGAEDLRPRAPRAIAQQQLHGHTDLAPRGRCRRRKILLCL